MFCPDEMFLFGIEDRNDWCRIILIVQDTNLKLSNLPPMNLCRKLEVSIVHKFSRIIYGQLVVRPCLYFSKFQLNFNFWQWTEGVEDVIN